MIRAVGQFAYPLAPDPIHGVWRGDDRGLIYTDGVNTRRIDFAVEPCTVVWPNDLAVDAAGTVWLGTADGQILEQAITESNWTTISLPDLPQSKPGQPITAVAISPDGTTLGHARLRSIQREWCTAHKAGVARYQLHPQASPCHKRHGIGLGQLRLVAV